MESFLVAVDYRYLDPLSFIADLHRMKVHPPLFRILAAPVLILAGFDHRAAALVSLAGWIGMVLLVFLVVKRIAPSHGNVAALAAALFALRSPAHQAYATDIMLDSLGACLTLLALFLYMSAGDRVDPGGGCVWLGCGLTALFFLKYNYWFLTLLSLLVWEAITRHREILWGARRVWVHAGLRRRAWREACHPITVFLLWIIALSVVLALARKQTFSWAGRRITRNASLDLTYAFFVLLCVRVGSLCWRHRHAIGARVGAGGRQLFWWHIVPVALWLLWPLRLQTFLWYLSPMNSLQAQRAGYWSWQALWFYPRSFLVDYHDAAWTAAAAIALALIAFACAPRLAAHARLVLLCLALSAILTFLHPNRQGRFLHTWVPLLWVAAGVGVASIFGGAARRGPLGVHCSLGVAAVFIVALLAKPVTQALALSAALDPPPPLATALDLSDYYLPRIGCYRHVSIFASLPLEFFAWWTYLEWYPAQRHNLSIVMKRLGGPAGTMAGRFADWLGGTDSQAIVFIDVPPGSTFYWSGADDYQRYRDLLRSQTVFREVERRAFPDYGATVSILVRGGPDASPFRCVGAQGVGRTAS